MKAASLCSCEVSILVQFQSVYILEERIHTHPTPADADVPVRKMVWCRWKLQSTPVVKSRPTDPLVYPH